MEELLSSVDGCSEPYDDATGDDDDGELVVEVVERHRALRAGEVLPSIPTVYQQLVTALQASKRTHSSTE